jgi:hypothetical protein
MAAAQVEAAAGRKADEELDRLRGIVLRKRARGRDNEKRE